MCIILKLLFLNINDKCANKNLMLTLCGCTPYKDAYFLKFVPYRCIHFIISIFLSCALEPKFNGNENSFS